MIADKVEAMSNEIDIDNIMVCGVPNTLSLIKPTNNGPQPKPIRLMTKR